MESWQSQIYINSHPSKRKRKRNLTSFSDAFGAQVGQALGRLDPLARQIGQTAERHRLRAEVGGLSLRVWRVVGAGGGGVFFLFVVVFWRMSWEKVGFCMFVLENVGRKSGCCFACWRLKWKFLFNQNVFFAYWGLLKFNFNWRWDNKSQGGCKLVNPEFIGILFAWIRRLDHFLHCCVLFFSCRVGGPAVCYQCVGVPFGTVTNPFQLDSFRMISCTKNCCSKSKNVSL